MVRKGSRVQIPKTAPHYAHISKNDFKRVLELFLVLVFLTALILLALAIFGTGESTAARVMYALGGIIAAPLSLLLLVLANPKDTEGSILFILLSFINWPR